jgi:ABC-type polysaccharide/polyol phosphate export permease
VIQHALATFRQRALILELAKNDFRARYTGSLLGVTWAFAQPVLTIVLYLFIYKVGFRTAPPQQVPFVLWLIVGMAPWFFFIDALSGATISLLEYSFLVKKIVFEVSILPTIKVVSAAFIHTVVWSIVLLILSATGFTPKVTWAFAPYYFVALFALVSGISLFSAAITPFFRDMIQVVAVGLQFAFWLTPILWSIDTVPPNLAHVLSLNPVYYVVQGLRESLLLGRTPLSHPVLTAWFWGVVLLLNLFGVLLFRRLRPHLPDVL